MKRKDREDLGPYIVFVVTGYSRKQVFNAVQGEEEPKARCRTSMSNTVKQGTSALGRAALCEEHPDRLYLASLQRMAMTRWHENSD